MNGAEGKFYQDSWTSVLWLMGCARNFRIARIQIYANFRLKISDFRLFRHIWFAESAICNVAVTAHFARRRARTPVATPAYVFALAFNFTWPFCNSTEYSTAWQPCCLRISLVFFFTKVAKLSRLPLTASPDFFLAATNAL